MTSRERVRATMAREPVDRMPVDLGGTNVTSIHPVAYRRLKDLLGLEGRIDGRLRDGMPLVYDVEGLAAEAELPVVKALGGDFLYIKRLRYRYDVPNRDWRPWTLEDGTAVGMAGGYDLRPDGRGGAAIFSGGRAVSVMPAGASGFDPASVAGREKPRPQDIVFPALSDEDCRHLEETSRAAWEGTDLALTGEWHGKGLLGAGCLFAGGMEGFLCDLLLDPGYAHAVLDRYADHYGAQLVPFFQAVGERLAVYDFYDDFGGQNGPLVSPEVFRGFFAPRYAAIIDRIRSLSRCSVFFHSCGAVRDLIPQMIRMGIDCLNPVQPGVPGMEPGSLKREFGDRLVFWGGAVNSQTTLEKGTPGEVREEAARNAAVLGAGGGYVFAASHNIQRRVPARNITALFEAAAGAARGGIA